MFGLKNVKKIEGKEVIQIPTEQIKPNPYQPRKDFAVQPLEELARSIAEYGVLQPIIVRKTGLDTYELVAGERRLRACKIAGYNSIPAIVLIAAEKDSAVIAMMLFLFTYSHVLFLNPKLAAFSETARLIWSDTPSG